MNYTDLSFSEKRSQCSYGGSPLSNSRFHCRPINSAHRLHDCMPRQVSGIGEFLLISPPQLFHVRVGLNFIKGRRRVGKILLCTAFPGRCNERRTEIGWDDALAVELAQNVQIIRVPPNTAEPWTLKLRTSLRSAVRSCCSLSF